MELRMQLITTMRRMRLKSPNAAHPHQPFRHLRLQRSQQPAHQNQRQKALHRPQPAQKPFQSLVRMPSNPTNGSKSPGSTATTPTKNAKSVSAKNTAATSPK